MATADGDPPQPFPADLDDNGFPDLPSSPAAATTTSSGFAEDFYRSGTDWSSLRAPPPRRPPEGAAGVKAKGKEGGSLVQSSLFQAWGIERLKREGGGAGDPSPSPSRSGSWSGRKRRRGGPEEAAAAAGMNPRTCPFYKKIPGKGLAVSWMCVL